MLSKLSSATTGFSSSIRHLSKFATAYEALDQRGDVVNLTSLNNGLRVASYANNRSTATIGLWINAGSRYETVVNNGVAMVYEKMVHTGSTNRNAMQLQNELAKMGVTLRSYTDREHIAFFADCLSRDVEKVASILVDVVGNTNIDTAKVEEQRDIALKRLDKFEAENNQGVVMDNLHMTAFQGTPMAMSPLGTTKALNSLTVEAVKNYVKDSYKPYRMVLSCAGGGVDHDNLHKIAEKSFGNLENAYDQKIPSHALPTSYADYEYIDKIGVRFSGSEFIYRDDTYPYIYGAIAVEGVPRGHLDYLALEVAKTYVGQWDRTYGAGVNAPSSIIQKSSVNSEIMGFESFNLSYDNTGLFGFYFVLRGNDIDPCQEAMRPMQRGWKHLAVSVMDDEVDKAKNALKTNLFTSLESNAQLARYVATEVLSTGKVIPLDQLERKIHYIDANAMREAVSRHIYDREIACAGIGKTEALPIYQEMRYAMSWWRL